ncbi:MAG TPA: 23S rRNA (adenine(2503)-C(2))-methyltransferase RlmN, partial [Paludibacter sp.]
MKTNLFGLTPTKLKTVVSSLGLPTFTATQLAEWMYKKQVSGFADMTNLSKQAREKLETEYTVQLIPSTKVQISTDGTKKYLYPTQTAKFIEAAYIPDSDRATLCVSTQIGCKMGCLFC